MPRLWLDHLRAVPQDKPENYHPATHENVSSASEMEKPTECHEGKHLMCTVPRLA